MNMDRERIARKFDVAPVHVSRLFGAFRRAHPDAAVNEELSGYRELLKRKSVVALERGLDDGTDPYKFAGVGVATLTGIGEFAGDQPRVGGIQITIFLPASLGPPPTEIPSVDMMERPTLPEADGAEEPPKGKTEDSEE